MDYKALLLSPSGRLNRQPYWLTALCLIVVVVPFAIIGSVTDQTWIAAVAQLATIWPSIVVAIKRCHDRDRSGWFMLVSIIPILNIWILIELGFLRGTVGPNRFGSDPLLGGNQGDVAAVF